MDRVEPVKAPLHSTVIWVSPLHTVTYVTSWRKPMIFLSEQYNGDRYIPTVSYIPLPYRKGCVTVTRNTKSNGSRRCHLTPYDSHRDGMACRAEAQLE
jgi:hypothetical protein